MEAGSEIAVDSNGCAYVIGMTMSKNFPLAKAFDKTFGGAGDAFVVKLSAKGNALAYSTYLGGAGDDQGTDIDLDSSGSAYIVGSTTSADFPLKNALDSTISGGEAFVTKIAADGASLSYSTFLGGGQHDIARAVAVDAEGAAYVAGTTQSKNFPRKNPIDDVMVKTEAFVAKILPGGKAIAYSTFLGGSGDWDLAQSVAVDASGAAYVSGMTDSPDFPIANAFDSTLDAVKHRDAFVSKLNAAGSALVYSTFLGGSDVDAAQDIAVDNTGQAYVVGHTLSANFRLKTPWQNAHAGGGDVFITKFASSGKKLIFSTYLGGKETDAGSGIALSEDGAVFITGLSYSNNFPVKNAYDKSCNGRGDAFVAKIKS